MDYVHTVNMPSAVTDSFVEYPYLLCRLCSQLLLIRTHSGLLLYFSFLKINFFSIYPIIQIRRNVVKLFFTNSKLTIILMPMHTKLSYPIYIINFVLYTTDIAISD